MRILRIRFHMSIQQDFDQEERPFQVLHQRLRRVHQVLLDHRILLIQLLRATRTIAMPFLMPAPGLLEVGGGWGDGVGWVFV